MNITNFKLDKTNPKMRGKNENKAKDLTGFFIKWISFLRL